MAKQELLVEVKKLISIGKEKGFLTYDERQAAFRHLKDGDIEVYLDGGSLAYRPAGQPQEGRRLA